MLTPTDNSVVGLHGYAVCFSIAKLQRPGPSQSENDLHFSLLEKDLWTNFEITF